VEYLTIDNKEHIRYHGVCNSTYESIVIYYMDCDQG